MHPPARLPLIHAAGRRQAPETAAEETALGTPKDFFLQVIHVLDPANVPVPGACMGPAVAVAALAACTERLRDALRCDPDLMDAAVDAAKLIFSPSSILPKASEVSEASARQARHGACIGPVGPWAVLPYQPCLFHLMPVCT